MERKANYRTIAHEYRCNNPQQNASKPNSATYKEDFPP